MGDSFRPRSTRDDLGYVRTRSKSSSTRTTRGFFYVDQQVRTETRTTIGVILVLRSDQN
jgi:hypothetical protein